MLNRADRVVDTFACGLKIARGTRVVMPWPYRSEGTYEYPLLGVSSLTNAAVSTSRGMVQYPAELLELPNADELNRASMLIHQRKQNR